MKISVAIDIAAACLMIFGASALRKIKARWEKEDELSPKGVSPADTKGILCEGPQRTCSARGKQKIGKVIRHLGGELPAGAANERAACQVQNQRLMEGLHVIRIAQT